MGGGRKLTISLNAKIHLRLRRMGDSVTAEFDFGAVVPKETTPTPVSKIQHSGAAVNVDAMCV